MFDLSDDGEVELHWPCGALLARGPVVDGALHGLWELFTQEGELLLQATLSKGEVQCSKWM